MWFARPNMLIKRPNLLENPNYTPKDNGGNDECAANCQREQSVQRISVEQRFAAGLRLLRLP